MKYEIIERGRRIEAIGAHSGYRIRLSTLPHSPTGSWPVHAGVRGSESEDEVAVPIPHRLLPSVEQALDYGYECAVLWIDAQDHRLG